MRHPTMTRGRHRSVLPEAGSPRSPPKGPLLPAGAVPAGGAARAPDGEFLEKNSPFSG